LDVFADDPLWAEWLHRQFTLAAVRYDLAINDIASGTRRDDPRSEPCRRSGRRLRGACMRWHQGTPRSVLEKFAAVQMIDVHRPTTDGRELVLTRFTEPEPELSLLLKKLKLAARPTTPKNHCRSRFSDPAVVPAFGGRLQRSQIFRSLKVLQSAKLG
jgi:hypothetical protein